MEKKVFLLVLFCIIFILGTGSVKAGCVSNSEDYTCGDTVYESCTMNQSVSSNGTCFTIGAESVVLDCDDNFINYSLSEEGYGISNLGGYDNIIIRNCIIKQANVNHQGFGIFLNNSDNSLVEYNNLTRGKAGIVIMDSDSVTVQHNYGEYFEYGTGTTSVCDPFDTGSYEAGIWLVDSNNGTIYNNTIQGNETGRGARNHGGTESGITLCRGNYTNISDNTIRATDQFGLNIVSNSIYNDIFYNFVNGSSDYGGSFPENTNEGIKIDNSDNNNVSYNEVYSGDRYGIYLYYVNNSFIYDNTLDDSVEAIRIRDSDYITIKKNVANSNRDGIILFESDNCTVIDNTVDSSNNAGIKVHIGCYNINLTNNIASNNGYGISTRGGHIIVNNTLTDNSLFDVYLTDIYDVQDCDSFVFENNTGSGNREIKFYNYTVNLNDEIYSELILCNAPNSTLDNVTINGSAIRNNNVLFVFHTNNSNFTDIDSSNNNIGLWLQYSSNNIVSYSNFSYGSTGIIFDYGSSNNIVKHTISNFNSGSGFWLYSGLNNSLINITANSNSKGIYIFGSSNNSIINSTATSNSEGIHIRSSSEYNTVENSNFSQSTSKSLHTSADYNSFTNSYFLSPGVNTYGIRISGGESNTFTNCEFSGNRGVAFYFGIDSKQNKIIDSNISNSSTDIYSRTTGANNTFLNVSFNKSNTVIARGVIYVKWYMDVFVNLRGLFNPPNAIVNAYDVNNNLYFSEETDSDGYLIRQNVTEYYETNAGKTYLTEYSVNATKDGYNSQWTEYVNLTTNFIDKNRIVLKIRRDPN